MPFQFFPCESLQGPIIVEPRCFADNRGFFMETFKAGDFSNSGITLPFVQDNQSLSLGPVVRGLHFQLPPKAQGKLIRVLEGKVWDIAVDLRAESPTFLRWIAVELDDQDNRMLYIPPGFAHGFATLSERTTLFYKCTAEYDPACDTGIRWNDPALNIPWPLENPQISTKDSQLPLLDPAFFRGLSW
jgi:dTDP-4-dehydrorhamnose 3,5-epimerase